MANDVTIHVKAEDRASMAMGAIGKKVEVEAKRSFLKSGGHAGAAFAAGFIKTMTFGMVGSGFAQSAVKMAPKMAHIGGVLGAGLAAGLVMQAVKAVGAVLPLALGAIMAAGPVMFLVKGMLNAEEKAKQSGARLDSLRKRYGQAQSKDARKRIMEEIKDEEAFQQVYMKRAHNFHVLKAKAREFMAYISQPFEIPLEKSMKAIGTWMEKNKKLFKGISKEIAPALEGLTKGALKGITNFLKEIDWEAVGAGMKAWGDALPGIGRSMGKLIDKILKDPEGTVDAVKGLAKGIEDVGQAAGDAWAALDKFTHEYDQLAKWIDKHENTTLGGDNILLPKPSTVRKQGQAVAKAFRWVVSRIGDALDNLKGHLAEARAGISRTWSRIVSTMRSAGSRARAAVDRFAEGVKDRFHQVVSSARNMRNQIAQAWNRIVADVRSMMSRFVSRIRSGAQQAMAAVRNLKNRIVSFFSGAAGWLVSAGARLIRGFVSGAKAAARGAGGAIIGAVRSVIPDALEKYIPGLAHGGYVGARAGGGGPRGGRVLVGEQGPEFADLPYGTKVHSNADSRRMAAEGGRGGGVYITINAPNYVGAPADLLRALVDAKRRGQLDVILR